MGSLLTAALTWLLSMATPVVKRVMIALGLGTITYTGLDVAFGAVKASVIGSYGQMAADSAQIAAIAGVPQAIGIILGALGARLGLLVLSRIGMVL